MANKNQNTQEVKNERFLKSTRQNNVHIFGLQLQVTLSLTNRQIDQHIIIKYKMGKSLAESVSVTVEDRS